MPKLKTDFFTVAQSGPTVDEREIKASWLTDAANTYSQSTHISKIWPEHMRWRPFGEIADVREQKGESGVVKLEARISPNDDLIYFIRNGRMTQPSIEIIEEFAGGKTAYLYGLGATDSPASLGVGKMPVLFSQHGLDDREAFELYTQRIAMDAGAPSEKVHVFRSPVEWADLEFKKENSIFDLGKWFSRGQQHQTSQPHEDLEMDKKDLLEVLATFKTELKEELKQEFATQAPAQAAPAAEPASVETPEQTEEPAQVFTAEQANKLAADLKDFNAKYSEFAKFAASRKTPVAPEHGGTQGDDPWNGW